MSLQVLNGENVTSEKSTESSDFLFSPPQLTGSLSVLRPSQKENVPPKNLARAMKVTFQTPLRDPQTHRILSPSMTSKLEMPFVLYDTTGLENSHQVWTQKENQQFIKEVDSKTTNGILQKQVVAGADTASGNRAPAFEGGTSRELGLDPPANPGASSSPQSPGSPRSQMASSKKTGSPEQAVEEPARAPSSDWSVTPFSETLGDPPRTAAIVKAEIPLKAEGENASGRGCASSATAAAPLITSPKGVCGGVSPAGLPSEAPASPGGVGTPMPADSAQSLTHPENAPAPGPLVADRATTLSPREEATGQKANSWQSEPLRLEFDFSDGVTSKRAPPQKRLGKRPGLKPPSKSMEVGQEQEAKEGSTGKGQAEHPKPAPWGSYHLNWDELGGPDLNPFGGDAESADREARPPGSSETMPAQPVAEQLGAGPQATEDSSVSLQLFPTSVEDTPVTQTTAETPSADSKAGDKNSSDTSAPMSYQGSEAGLPTHHGPQPALELREESFRDPAEVLGTGAEVDYLEQFGASSFKESALRKQSLYLKFDPLLKDSPHRPEAVTTGPDSLQDKDRPSSGNPPEATLVELDFLGALDAPVQGPSLCILGPGGPPLLSTGPILDLLQYSQKDLDVAVKAAQEENLELKSRCEELHRRNVELGKIMDRFEEVVYQAMEEAQKQKDLAQAEIQKVLKEKEQLIADLNSMEKSFSDLFKRFEKQKEVIEGYRKNEESLKRCVEEYLVRIDKEGQRYQALKAQAEEKLKLANEEIAQVRSKAKAEALALQASLRKEQMRSHSLEKMVEQKTKENDELTRICDDLISKMEKI
ncbi:transforming acidic coiled-coil-containing protein 3 [Nycticebus coucang]|uniref:transforming acidic coiled-coil-containing protein 3 n=1 Tax=Nycticebus coucang TaxID=9470 RepID=UPI00234C8476|nr:transforming acidic coiled-coil-containing protein 3 [Nycticebus coucang]XP_053433769.1 transforming acidic coiled-coil-containing protein 3 [Nycticebus coucang]XP_053433770.1 transforming acidic coiled-coil-containing protein 3 [Nycticebus coucang]